MRHWTFTYLHTCKHCSKNKSLYEHLCLILKNLHHAPFIESFKVGHCEFKCKGGSVFAFELLLYSNNQSRNVSIWRLGGWKERLVNIIYIPYDLPSLPSSTIFQTVERVKKLGNYSYSCIWKKMRRSSAMPINILISFLQRKDQLVCLFSLVKGSFPENISDSYLLFKGVLCIIP